MHFRRLKLRRKDKVSPEGNKHEDTPNTPKEAVVTPVPLSPPKEPEKPMQPEPPQSQTSPAPPQDQQLTGPGPGPLGPALADNAEIQQIWAEIQKKVASLAVRNGRSVDTGMGIGQVMDTLESTERPDEEPSKKDAVKKVFGRTLNVIQTVGGFVADGASQVRDIAC